jgi:catechol 2,3-dioxygenase-like lactoylglutathione lyase family enzyme
LSDSDRPPSLRIELFVADVERSARFYEDVLGFVRVRESDGYIAVHLGDAHVGIGVKESLPAGHPLRPGEDERVGVGVEIVIEVNDVVTTYGHVEASGHSMLVPLSRRPWGLDDFRIVDPDGYYLRITNRTEQTAVRPMK